MERQWVSVQIPQHVYERMQQIAQESQRPLETVLLDSLTILYDDQFDLASLAPDDLSDFSDDQLWALVWRPLTLSVDLRLRELTEIGKRGLLSESESAEIDQLIEAVDHYVLLRSEALLLLKQRGHDVERRLKQGA